MGIVRKLEVREEATEEEIKEMENQLIEWGIHLASRFQDDDNYFVVEFENEIDLMAFETAHYGFGGGDK